MRLWTFALAALLTLAVPTAAQASTIRTDTTKVSQTPPSGPGHASASTTDTANCRGQTANVSMCRLGNRQVEITADSQDDFVRATNGGGQPIIFHGGGGSDRIFPDGGTRIIAFGDSGNDDLQGNAGIDTLDGGAGDDKLAPFGSFDTVIGGPGFDTVQMQGGGVIVTLDDVHNDGPPGARDQDIRSDVERVLGWTGDDELAGNALPNTLEGGEGADTLNGLGGSDTLLGGIGADTIQARDGVADNVSCGPGADRAIVDPADSVAADCETVEYADSDGDGVDARRDCDDANPAVHPGATDVPGNGVDEDCSGQDTPVDPPPPPNNDTGGTNTTIISGVIDADHDGVSPPLDCDDANAARRPGVADAPGDGIDQDCSGADAALANLQARVTHRWDLAATWSRVVELTVRDAPSGAKVTVRCTGRGCAFRTREVNVNGGRAALANLFKRRKLNKGAVVDVTVSAPGFVGKVVRFTVRGKKKLPRQQQLCQPPTARSPQRCG
jgi:hypothetical protein